MWPFTFSDYPVDSIFARNIVPVLQISRVSRLSIRIIILPTAWHIINLQNMLLRLKLITFRIKKRLHGVVLN